MVQFLYSIFVLFCFSSFHPRSDAEKVLMSTDIEVEVEILNTLLNVDLHQTFLMLPNITWSRHAIVKTVIFAIEILYALLSVKCHQNFLMLNFYTTYKFLSNFFCRP